MPTDEEKALYGLMVVAEETTKLAQSTIQELPAELTKQLAPRLEAIEKSTASVQAALAALPDVVKQTEEKIRSTGLRLTLYSVGVCLVVAFILVFGLWWWQSSLIDERAELQAQVAQLQAAIRAETSTLRELRSKTWGLELIAIDGKRWIRFKRGDIPGEKVNWEKGKWHGIEVKP